VPMEASRWIADGWDRGRRLRRRALAH
jgi:hypothetical protein